MITENLSTLKIHKLTQEQYDREFDNGRIDETALYLTPDDSVDLASAQTITGVKTFSNGITIGNATITNDTENKRLVISFE